MSIRKHLKSAYKNSILWAVVNLVGYLPLAFIALFWTQEALVGVVALLVVPAIMCVWICLINLFQGWLGWDKYWKLLITVGLVLVSGILMNINYASSDAVAGSLFVFATIMDASPMVWVVLLATGPWHTLPFHLGYCLLRALYVALMLSTTMLRQKKARPI